MGDTYRLLYAFPVCFALALGLYRGATLLMRGSNERYAPLATAILIVLISIPHDFPWRGRGWFQVQRPPSELELGWLGPISSWFSELVGSEVKHCEFLSDTATSFGLESTLALHFYYPYGGNSRGPNSYLHDLPSREEFLSFIKDQRICAIVLVDRDAKRTIPRSVVGRLSGHWDENSVSQTIALPDRAYQYAQLLERDGWDEIRVPPFFSVLIRPDLKDQFILAK